MRKKNKYVIKTQWQLDKEEEIFEIYGEAEKIYWNRYLKNLLKRESITKYEITKIE